MIRAIRLGAVCAGALLGSASTAHAACYSSTPAATTFADSPFDGDYGLAPEITTVAVGLDAACSIAVSPGIDALIDDDAVFVYIDRDGNPATGSALFRGADIVVGTLGVTGPDLPPLLGTWNGASFTFTDSAPVGPAPSPGGFIATVDRLGIPSGATIALRVGTSWRGVYDNYFDWAPEPAAPGIGLPVVYSTSAPPPPPAPAPAPQPAAPTPPAPVAVEDTRCRVPKLKGRSRGSAEDRLLDANCEPARGVIRRYSTKVRRGRVIGSSPAAGKRTTRRVKLIISLGRKPKRARASASVLTRLEALANAQLR